MGYKIKSTLEGYDVLSETDPKKFSFNSDYGGAVIYKQGMRTVNISSRGTTQDILDYGITFDYYPMVKIHAELTPNSGVWYENPFIFTSSYYNSESSYIVKDFSDTYVDYDKFYITFKNTTGSSISVRYYYWIIASMGK